MLSRLKRMVQERRERLEQADRLALLQIQTAYANAKQVSLETAERDVMLVFYLASKYKLSVPS